MISSNTNYSDKNTTRTWNTQTQTISQGKSKRCQSCEGVVMKFPETMPKLDETTGVDKKNQEYSKSQAAGARFDQR
jgi:hypothetical protein